MAFSRVARNFVTTSLFKRYVLTTIMMILVVYTMVYLPISRSLHHKDDATSRLLEIEQILKEYNISKHSTLRKQKLLSETTIQKAEVTTTQSKSLQDLSTRNPFEANEQIEEEPRRGDEHIIFLETSCILGVKNNSSGLVLKPRSACAIESAAKTNPSRKVYVIYSCPIKGDVSNSSEHVMGMFMYPNVRIWHLNVTEYFKDTPLEKWNFFKQMNTSKWPLSHSSDVLRYLSLWKYGGTYLDMDFIMIKPLDKLGSNFVGAQSHNYIASGALNFRTEGVGEVVAHLCIRDLQKNFKGNVWGMNGPEVVTRVLKNLCGKGEIREMTKKECLGFSVYPPEIFYKIPYWSHKLFFEEKTSNITMAKFKRSYGVHVWNKMTTSINVIVGSKQPYGLLAEEFCPKVYSTCGRVF